jgi:hypothetical protein
MTLLPTIATLALLAALLPLTSLVVTRFQLEGRK